MGQKHGRMSVSDDVISKVADPIGRMITTVNDDDDAISQLPDDEISQLPDPIIGHILEFMPFRDAVRTSLVSRAWRRKWFHMTRIEVENNIGELTSREKLLSMLQEHDGPIFRFHIYVPAELQSCSVIDRIFLLLSNKGVRMIYLYGSPKASVQVLDSSLLSCAGQLTFLALGCCVLQRPPPEFTGFTKLVTLFLHEVNTTAQLLSTLISQSPLLQTLVVYNHATSCFNDHLEVTAPNLNLFYFQGNSKAMISVASPRLVDVSMALPFEITAQEIKQDSTDDQVLRLASADSILSLHLDHHYMNCLHRCGSGLKFKHLRHLKLTDICFGMTHEVKWILELMKSCVILEKILIQAFHVGTAERQDDDVAFGEALDLSCSHVREVWMLDISGSKNELAFIKTLLLKLLKLETMIIAPADVKNGGDSLCKLVCQFRRASPLAIVDFRDLNECRESLYCQFKQSLERQFQF